MKKYILALLPLVSVLLYSAALDPQDYENIIVTKNRDAVKDLEYLGDVEHSVTIIFGSKKKLKEKCLPELKKKAAELGADIILLITEDYVTQPINGVTLEGHCYKNP